MNESGYLFFSPNLAEAYNDLNKSASLISTDPGNAIAYASAARSSAMLQYEKMDAYRAYSIAAAAAFTLVMALILYAYMRPVARHQRRK